MRPAQGGRVEWPVVERPEGVLPPERALDVADAISSALEAGWEAGLVHRDVKPHNVMVDLSNNPFLMDFGLAKRSNEDSAVTTEHRG